MSIVRNSVLILFAILLFSGYVIGLTCFSCQDCNDPFVPSPNDTITIENGTGLSCMKTKGAGLVDRNITDDCLPFTAVGNGVWCCTTDLCNAANRILSIPSLSVILIVNLFLFEKKRFVFF